MVERGNKMIKYSIRRFIFGVVFVSLFAIGYGCVFYDSSTLSRLASIGFSLITFAFLNIILFGPGMIIANERERIASIGNQIRPDCYCEVVGPEIFDDDAYIGRTGKVISVEQLGSGTFVFLDMSRWLSIKIGCFEITSLKKVK